MSQEYCIVYNAKIKAAFSNFSAKYFFFSSHWEIYSHNHSASFFYSWKFSFFEFPKDNPILYFGDILLNYRRKVVVYILLILAGERRVWTHKCPSKCLNSWRFPSATRHIFWLIDIVLHDAVMTWARRWQYFECVRGVCLFPVPVGGLLCRKYISWTFGSSCLRVNIFNLIIQSWSWKTAAWYPSLPSVLIVRLIVIYPDITIFSASFLIQYYVHQELFYQMMEFQHCKMVDLCCVRSILQEKCDGVFYHHVVSV